MANDASEWALASGPRPRSHGPISSSTLPKAFSWRTVKHARGIQKYPPLQEEGGMRALLDSANTPGRNLLKICTRTTHALTPSFTALLNDRTGPASGPHYAWTSTELTSNCCRLAPQHNVQTGFLQRLQTNTSV